MTTNATIATSPSKGCAAPVKVIETFTGAHGVEYTRALSKEGIPIVAPSRFFKKEDNGNVTADAKEISLDAGIAALKAKWHK